jgi:O-acetyl-ADP-ribose deacetylase (regulator of RNase III)
MLASALGRSTLTLRSEGPMQPAEPAAGERMHITWIAADITILPVDAVVTAANSALAGGGGVDGAVHRAAGPGLQAACRTIGGCPTGEARITPGFRLTAAWVIHAVGPVWRGGGEGEAALLAGAYASSLVLAQAHACRSIAFPAISCGIYGFPVGDAMRIAVETVAGWRQGMPERAVFAAFDAAVVAALTDLLGPPAPAAG